MKENDEIFSNRIPIPENKQAPPREGACDGYSSKAQVREKE